MSRVLLWFRALLWPLLFALYLIVVGLWPPAAAPVTLAIAGAAVIVASIPVQVWLLTAAIAWFKHRPTTA